MKADFPAPLPMKGDILIVDDTPDNLRLLANMLLKQGYSVRTSISGSAALMAVDTQKPDLILLDINMPQMDGYEVCELLKANDQTKSVPVIFLSAFSETTEKVKAFQVGGVDYISKPFQVEEVLARVETHLTLSQVHQKLQQALTREKEINQLKSEFVSMVSHDFRMPLMSIQGFAELLRYQGASLTLEVQKRYFDKIGASVHHLLYLLDQILLIGRSESGKFQCYPSTIALEPFCREIIENLQLTDNYQHPIHFEFQGDCQAVEIDSTLFSQILINLLSNAVKYSSPGQEILLNLQCQEEEIIFQIQDHGIGIPLAEQSHLFELFYRCSNASSIRGSGLGLAVVKICVEAHQGQISLSSTANQGTTVTVQLPRIQTPLP